MEEELCLSITVSHLDDSGTWTVLVGWIDAMTGSPRSYGVLCSYSELPSVLCEVAHELPGFITLSMGGVFG